MPPQLAQVVSGGIPHSPATATFLKIQESNLDLRAFAFRRLDSDKQVFGITAAMLPTRKVQTSKRRTQFPENGVMDRRIQLVRGRDFIPLIKAGKPLIQRFGDQQSLPLPTLPSRFTINYL